MAYDSNNTRVLWVDNLKSLGIFLVIFAHHDTNKAFVQYVYSFHMPLFFFLSGYTYDASKFRNFGYFFQRKVRTLVVPYFFFAISAYLFWITVVRFLSVEKAADRIDPLMPLIGIFYTSGTGVWLNPMATALWFLICLFVTEIFFWFLLEKTSKLLDVRISLLISAVVGAIAAEFLSFHPPWSIDVAFTAVVFYGVGFLARDKITKFADWITLGKFLLVGMPMLALGFVFNVLNGPINMHKNGLQNAAFFYVAAFCGILLFLGLSNIIPKNRVLQFIGKNTIVLLGFSGVSLYLVRSAIFAATHSVPYLKSISLGTAAAYTVLQIVFLVPIIFLLNRYFPFFLGRKKLKNSPPTAGGKGKDISRNFI